MRVVCFVADRVSASSRLRVLQYERCLRRDGVTVRVCVTRPSKYLPYPVGLPDVSGLRALYGLLGVSLIVLQRLYQICAHVPRADVVLLQKDLLFRSRLDFLERLLVGVARVRGARLVFDIDDAIYLGTSMMSLPRLDAKVQRVASAASVVLAGSEPIASHLRPFSGDIRLAPTCLTLEGRPAPRSSRPNRMLSLAWVGTASSARHLEVVSASLRQLARRGLVRIEVVTRLADLPDELLNALPDVELTEWTETAEAEILARSHIAVAPLLDEPFTRAKCGGKVLAYFAAALPVVASPVGAQAIMVRHDSTGLIATSEDEWSECLAQLCHSGALRERLGRAGRAYLEAHRSAERQYSQWRHWVLGPEAARLGRSVADHLPAT